MLEIELNKLKEKVSNEFLVRLKNRYQRRLNKLQAETSLVHKKRNEELYEGIVNDRLPKLMGEVTWSLNIKSSYIVLKVHTSKRNWRYQQFERVLKDLAKKFDRVWFTHEGIEFIHLGPYHTATIELRSRDAKDIVAFIVKHKLNLKKNYCVAKLQKHIDRTGRYWLTSRRTLNDLKTEFEENGLKW